MKKQIQYLVFIGLSLITVNSFAAPDCRETQLSQENVETCHDMADKALNASYRKLISLLKEKDNESDKAMIRAQRGWIELRDAQCEAYMLNTAVSAGISAMLCEIALTKQRTAELNKMQEGAFY
ncbi:MAG: lysozyme inhibitor LprI family protein [bacterium]